LIKPDQILLFIYIYKLVRDESKWTYFSMYTYKPKLHIGNLHWHHEMTDYRNYFYASDGVVNKGKGKQVF
jgi:hypothetical protein